MAVVSLRFLLMRRSVRIADQIKGKRDRMKIGLWPRTFYNKASLLERRLLDKIDHEIIINVSSDKKKAS
jgi:hypothetical protein